MEFQQIIERITIRIKQPLPGHAAHAHLSPRSRLDTSEYLRLNPAYKSGCVTLLVYPESDITRLLLMERTESNDAHSGQISFPGGKREMDDQSLQETALRETFEEVGIDPSAIQIIGQLSDIYIPVSNYLVHPFVGFANSFPKTKLNPQEVKSILTPELDVFMLDDLPRMQFKSKVGWIEAPYYSYMDYKIWGATAMMIRELVEIIKY